MSHEVADFATWKPIYDGDAPRREEAGFKDLAVGTQADNPKMVYMIWEGDPVALDSMMKDPSLADKMKQAGVISTPQSIVINT